MLFPKTTKAPFTADRNTEENDGFWPNLEFATHKVCELDLEGIVAKRKTAAYRATEKPSPYWIKIKNPHYSQAEGRDELFNPQPAGITFKV